VADKDQRLIDRQVSVRPKTKPSPDGFSLLVLQKTTGFASGFLLTFPAKSRFFTFLD
jgi:hypothetical protein